jgi:hypothetical protein
VTSIPLAEAIVLGGRVARISENMPSMNEPFPADALIEALQSAVLKRDIDTLVSTVSRFARAMRDAGLSRHEALATLSRAIDSALGVEDGPNASAWRVIVEGVSMRAIAACVDVYGTPGHEFGGHRLMNFGRDSK